jgi:hypothetical protein
MATKRNIVVKTSLSKDFSFSRILQQQQQQERKLDKTIAMRSPRWIQFDDRGSVGDDDALAMPPMLRAKLSMYMANAASASTMDDDTISFATVRTCELGIPPIWERKRKDVVEFVDYEFGEDATTKKEDCTTTTNNNNARTGLLRNDHE